MSLALLFFLVSQASGAVAPLESCQSAKVNSLSAMSKALIKSYSKWLANPSKDPLRERLNQSLSAAESKMQAAFEKAEAKAAQKGADCSPTLMTAGVQALIKGAAGDLEAAIETGLDLNNNLENKDVLKLGVTLLNAAGNKFAALLKAESANLKKPDQAKLDASRAKAKNKFESSWSKAIDQATAKGVAYTGPTVDEVETLIDTAVANIFATIEFQSEPTFSKNTVATGAAREVLVTIAVAPMTLDTASIGLYQSDANGAKGAKIGDMKDDGDFNGDSGDDVKGDGIFTAKLSINESTAGFHYYRAFGQDVPNFGASTVSRLIVVTQPTEEMVNNAKAHADDINSKWESLIIPAASQQMSKAQYLAAFEDAQQELVSYINGLPNAVFSQKGTNAVFYAMNDAPFIMLQETIPDVSQWENELDDGDSRGLPPALNPTKNPVFTAPDTSKTKRIKANADDDENTINDKKAIFVDPYYWQHVHSTKMTDANGSWTKIKDSKCPDLEESVVLNGSDASANVDPHTTDTAIIDAFTTLSNYGTIVIHTHGAYWDYAQSNWVTELEAEINALPDGPVKAMLQVWLTLQKESAFSWTGKKLMYASDVYMGIDYASVSAHKYWEDFASGRLYLATSGKIFITPSFIDAHNGTFPNSIVWSGACHSLQDESMSSVFINKGAGAYFGFSESVYRSWNVSRSGVVFEKMLAEGKTAKEAFDAAIAGGNNDGGGTMLVMKGNDDLKYNPSLQNPSFEDPKGAGSLQGWTVVGDGRAWHYFQSDAPTEGGTMAVVSSGLGHTTAYGSISQSFCVPDNVETLEFDWNFYSAEFLEYCHKGYDDTFQVTINGEQVFRTSVDTLCDEGGLYEVGPIDNTTDTFSSGWRPASIPISAYAGKDAKITFSIVDVGDEIYDTAVLIDNLILTTPAPAP